MEANAHLLIKTRDPNNRNKDIVVYEPLQEPNRYDLHLAVENNCPRSVEKLLQYNIPLVDSQHDTILSYASDPRVVKLLLDAGAPLTSRR
jgi:hypothetical protein